MLRRYQKNELRVFVTNKNLGMRKHCKKWESRAIVEADKEWNVDA